MKTTEELIGLFFDLLDAMNCREQYLDCIDEKLNAEKITIYTYLHTQKNPDIWILDAFSFAYTPQGYDFWTAVSNAWRVVYKATF